MERANAEYVQNKPQDVRGQHIEALRRRVAAESLCGCEKSNDRSDTDNESGDCRSILEAGDCSFLEALDPHSKMSVQLDEIRWSLVAQATYIPWCCPETYTCYPQHLACLFGHKDLATMMFEKKTADIHARDSRDNTTLMLAAASGSAMTMVALLLLMCKDEDDRKKLVTAQNKDGLTALHFAALSDDPQVVELLLDAGADVNAGQFTTLQNRRFALTPLHFALLKATLSSATIARMLIKSGADLSLEAATADSTWPCARIVRECSCGLCLDLDRDMLFSLLLPSYGAAYDGETYSIGNALHMKVIKIVDLSDILSEKQQRLLLNVPDGEGYLPLHTAVSYLDQKAVKILLSLGADVNAMMSGNSREMVRTALHILFNFELTTVFSCEGCYSKLQFSNRLKSCVSLLLQQPLVDPNARDQQGRTPLHVACKSGHYAFIEQLVACGANVLVEDDEGRTPLYYATQPADRAVREKLVDVLLRCGAALSCLNTPCLSLNSPLIYFGDNHDVAILLKLYRLGAITTGNLNRMLYCIKIIKEDAREDVLFAKIAAHKVEGLNPLSLYAQSIISEQKRKTKADKPKTVWHERHQRQERERLQLLQRLRRQEQPQPQEQAAQPQDQAAEPQDQKAEPQDQKAEPQDQKAEPQDQAAEPQDQTAEPQDQKAEPQDQKAEPQDQAAEPQDQTAEPQDQKAEPQDQKAEPQDQAAQPQEQAAEPQPLGDLTWNPDAPHLSLLLWKNGSKEEIEGLSRRSNPGSFKLCTGQLPRMTVKMICRFYSDIDFVEGPLQDFRRRANAEYVQNNPQAARGQHIEALRRRVAAESLCGCEKSNDRSDTDNEEGDSRGILEDGVHKDFNIHCSFLEALDPHSKMSVQLDEIRWSLVAQATYIPWCCTEPYTCYPQHLACLFGHKDLATMMFEKKAADIHARDSRDNTTLMMAAASGSAMTMVALLLLMCKNEDDRKKLVTSQNKDGLTALHFAALNDDPKVVELLLDAGADVNAGQFTTLQNRRFALTPLHFALLKATLPSANIAKILVKSGADLNLEAATAIPTLPCGTIAKECSCGLCPELADYILPSLLLPSYGALYDGKINSAGTDFHLAVKQSVDLSDILSEKQQRLLLNVPDCQGFLPLHSAVRILDQKAIKILLSLGADVNAIVSGNSQRLGCTALHFLFFFKLGTTFYCGCCYSSLQPSHYLKSCLSLLLQQPLVDLNARDCQGRTPLHFACKKGHYAFIEQLVACGANVLVEDNKGRPPLYYAACPEDRAVREKLVDVLLRCGAALWCLNTPYLSLHSPVVAFGRNYDVAILLKLYRIGAITTRNLRKVLYSIKVNMRDYTKVDYKTREEILGEAMAALQQEGLNPLSLYAQSIICVSKYIKAGSPQSRREAFMSLGLDHIKLETMQDLCLM
ncbi:hypothetical protein C0Q70_15532 [Pomacea canaliculata]|uniref:SOCS box domain-containing protein n=1 Tax=Pomacea canaliculata TaxID=400727 RepID=A0A2T7NV49_POMCA|nr:hypothetical protein C0Q70_15532 [Pomacea canaliculata]